MQRLQSGEVEIATIDDHDGTRRPLNHVEDLDVVHFAGGDMDENGNGATQIDNRVSLDGGLGRAKICPGKQSQAKVDGGRVHRVERLLETQPGVLALIQFDCGCNQSMAERLEQSPIASFVGVGQGRTGYLAANSNMVELGALRVEAS